MKVAFKRWHGALGLLQALLFAAAVGAHPLDDDAVPSVGLGYGALLDVPALADGYPEAVRDGARGLPSSAADLPGSVWLPDSLLSGDREAPLPLFVDAAPTVDQDGDLAGFDEPRTLSRALRAVVNVEARRPSGASSPQMSLPQQQIVPLLSEAIAEAVRQMEDGLAEVVSDSLDGRVDDDGRVTFSLLGVEGFHVTAGAGQMTIGRNDATLTFERGASPLQRRVAAMDAARSAQQYQPADGFHPLRDAIDLVVRTLQYPLFWVLVLLFAIGKIALMIATARSRRRSHRHSSAGEVPKVRRSRTRVRLKRVRTRIRLQQP